MGESFYQLIQYNYKTGLVPQFKSNDYSLFISIEP